MAISKGGVVVPPISLVEIDIGLQYSLRGLGVTDLNHLQVSIIPTLITGMDLVVTGGYKSGRTMGVIVGVLAAMIEKPYEGDGPRALFILSTREAAMATYDMAAALAAGCGLSTQIIIGRSQDPMVNEPSSGYDIVVATAGKALDVISHHRILLSRLQFLVFDEAHETLGNTGCGDHSRAWLRFMPKDTSHQTRVIITNTDAGDNFRLMRPQSLSTLRVHRSTAEWTMRKVATTPANKLERVRAVIERVESTSVVLKKQYIIFVPRMREAEAVTKDLTRFLDKKIDIVYSRKDTLGRLDAIERFNSGQLDTLVSCRIAASGISLNNILGVIFYDTTVAWQLLIATVNKMALREAGQCFVLYDTDKAGDLDRVNAIGERYVDECLGDGTANTDHFAPQYRYSLNNACRPSHRIIVQNLPYTYTAEDVERAFPWDSDFHVQPGKQRKGVTKYTGIIDQDKVLMCMIRSWFLIFGDVDTAQVFLDRFDKAFVENHVVKMGFAFSWPRQRD